MTAQRHSICLVCQKLDCSRPVQWDKDGAPYHPEAPAEFVDKITEYGTTSRLSRAIRVF